MWKSKIMAYMETTTPETALKNNNDSAIKTIRKEVKEEIKSLLSVKETMELCGMIEDAKEMQKQAFFCAKWLATFGVSD